jgi:hypothetical protein
MKGLEASLTSAGRRACFALQARLKLIPALSIAAKLTLFKNLVLPVLTYGCQVWAVHYLSLPPPDFNADSSTPVPDNPFEAIWLQYLRSVFCVGKYAPKWCLVHEARFDLIQKHFAKSVVRFWNRLHADEVPHISLQVAKADVRLMLSGSKHCWSYLLFSFLHQLGCDMDARLHPLFAQSRRHRNSPLPLSLFDTAWSLEVQEAVVITKLHEFWHDRVMRAVRGLDPRTPGVSHARTCK